jgi:FkbM family methyltransferase
LCRINGIDIARWMRLGRVPVLAGDDTDVTIRLRNGLPLRLERRQYITGKIARYGCFDPVLAEAVVRLARPGRLHIDVGANVGYTAVLMAGVAGPTGRVIAFEPAVRTYDRLAANTRAVNDVLAAAVIEPRREAVGAVAGHAELLLPEGPAIAQADGLSRLADSASARPAGGQWRAEAVRVVALRDMIGRSRPPALIKIDVEGREGEVVDGIPTFEDLDTAIVYEENTPYPGPAAQRLLARGFEIARLDWRGVGGVLGIRPADPTTPRSTLPPGFEPDLNFVASRRMPDVLVRLRGLGWRCA